MIASYSAELADDHGRWIRDAITTWREQIGIALHPGSKDAAVYGLTELADPEQMSVLPREPYGRPQLIA
ncbi:hypothetical protein [Kitasatospora viridis]|uniref:hypothetical protein n=1 Tax=Kitasatospora viridis TaxID=281105 RepID=UPI0011A2BC94|nr:hypothetical protein [Kitasatospora viridis]